jgi:hypothetical protein
MTNQKFKALKVGDKVTLENSLETYGWSAYFGSLGVPRKIEKGQIGICGAVGIPAVYGRERNFVCVDFPELKTEYKSLTGETLVSIPRVGAFKKDLV